MRKKFLEGNLIFRLLFPAAFLLVSACQSTPPAKSDPSLSEQAAAHIFVYRPRSDVAGFAIDYRVKINGQYVGSLRTGKKIDILVTPGVFAVEIGDYFLGIPPLSPVSYVSDGAAGEKYYLKFSKHFYGIIPLPSGPIVSGGLVLQSVSRSQWEALE